MWRRILLVNLYFGLSGLILSTLLLVLNVPFMKTWFYCFVWWSFILFLDSLNFRWGKRSLLSSSVRELLFSACLSVFVWLVFELFNLRVGNWTYQDLPVRIWERWLGYFIAFASVIPALQEISLLARSILRERKHLPFSCRFSPLFLKVTIALGVISFFLVLAWPRLFFPLVWLLFIFLLEPVNYWLNNRSFSREIEEGKWNALLSWLAAGFLAGILWELWNFWAGSHWQYSLPYLNFWRIFQMPLFGYLGFLPFAVEVFALHQFFSWIDHRVLRKAWQKAFLFFLFLIFCCGCFFLIDTFTLIR